MASTAYDLSVRKALNQKGIDNSRIGYANGFTTIDGNNFMKADKLYNGTNFTNQTNFNNAYNTYSANNAPKVASAASTVRGVISAPKTSTTNATTTGGTGFNVPKAAPTAATAVTPGSVQIRPALEASGINPNAIGYNAQTRSVTVNGQPFTVPSQSVNGSAYTSQQQYNTALNNYRVNDFSNQLANYQQAQNPYTQQLDDTIAYLMDYAKQQQVSDPYATPEYAAYAAQSGRRAQQGVRAAQEAFGGSGFGRSTALGERAQGIQNEETAYLETQVIPAILAAEQQRKQAQYNNVAALLNPLYNQQTSQDAREQNRFTNLYNTLATFADEKQRTVQNAQADAALTGYYQTPEQAELYNALIGLKNQAEAPGIGRDQRAALSAQADQIRTRLQGLGVDVSGLGAGSNAAAASKANPFRTVQGQQLDLQNRQTNIDTALRYGEQAGRLLTPQEDPSGYLRQVQNGAPLNYTAQQDKITNAQEDRRLSQTDRSLGQEDRRQTFTEESFAQEIAYKAQQDGIQNAIQWAGIEIQREGMQLNWAQLKEQVDARLIQNGFTREQIDQGWAGLDMDAQKMMMGGGSESAFTPAQITDSIRNMFQVQSKDANGDPAVDGNDNPITHFPKNRTEQMNKEIYEMVLNYGLPDADESQILNNLGFTNDQLKKLDTWYASQASVNSATGGGGSGKAQTYQQTTFQQGSGAGAGNFNVTSGVTSYVPAQLDAKLGGVLSGMGAQFVAAGKKYGINPAFLAAVAMHETGNGTSYSAKNRNNVGGMMKKKGGQQTFSSIPAGIDAMASNLKRLYVNEGKVTIPDIQRKYAPNGAANDPTNLNSNWTTGVTKYLNAFGKVSSA